MHEISGRKRPGARRALLAALSTIAVGAAAAAAVVLPANAAAPPLRPAGPGCSSTTSTDLRDPG